MRSGSACKVISLPCPNVADRQFTRCGPFSMRSSTCCAPAVRGATCQPTFRAIQTVFYHFRRLRDPRHLDVPASGSSPGRARTGGEEPPSKRCDHGCGIRVKTVEEGAEHLWLRCRPQAHLLVDTLGIPLSIYVTPADVHDTRGASCLQVGLAPLVPRLKKIWSDAAYRGLDLADCCPHRMGLLPGSGGARVLLTRLGRSM